MMKILAAGLAALAIAYAHLIGGPMDGTAWDIKIKRDSFFAFSHPDTLIFQKGQLTVAGYVPAGFTPATYEAKNEDPAVTRWTASFTQDEQGKVDMSGAVRGDAIEGIALWKTPEGKVKRYFFKGTRKTA